MKRLIRFIVAFAILLVGGLLSVVTLSAKPEEEIVRVMSYNIHRGGVVMLKQPLSQTAKAIQLAKADIVGIQETRSPRGDTLEGLAKLLDWNHDEGSCIVTRWKSVEHFKGGKDYRRHQDQAPQISMPTSLICTSHLIPTNLISFWVFAPSGTNTPMILPLSKPRQRRLSGPKRHVVQRLGNCLDR